MWLKLNGNDLTTSSVSLTFKQKVFLCRLDIMSGVDHEIRSTIVVALLAGGVVASVGQEEGLAFLAGGLLGTFFLSPDIDLPYSRPSKRWGALSFLWAPYRWLHPHRGLSHSYIYGPFSRLFYLSALVALISLVANLMLGVPITKQLEVKKVIIPFASGPLTGFFLVGYIFSQWAHLIQDGIAPFGGKDKKK